MIYTLLVALKNSQSEKTHWIKVAQAIFKFRTEKRTKKGEEKKWVPVFYRL